MPDKEFGRSIGIRVPVIPLDQRETIYKYNDDGNLYKHGRVHYSFHDVVRVTSQPMYRILDINLNPNQDGPTASYSAESFVFTPSGKFSEPVVFIMMAGMTSGANKSTFAGHPLMPYLKYVFDNRGLTGQIQFHFLTGAGYRDCGSIPRPFNNPALEQDNTKYPHLAGSSIKNNAAMLTKYVQNLRSRLGEKAVIILSGQSLGAITNLEAASFCHEDKYGNRGDLPVDGLIEWAIPSKQTLSKLQLADLAMIIESLDISMPFPTQWHIAERIAHFIYGNGSYAWALIKHKFLGEQLDRFVASGAAATSSNTMGGNIRDVREALLSKNGSEASKSGVLDYIPEEIKSKIIVIGENSRFPRGDDYIDHKVERDLVTSHPYNLCYVPVPPVWNPEKKRWVNPNHDIMRSPGYQKIYAKVLADQSFDICGDQLEPFRSTTRSL